MAKNQAIAVQYPGAELLLFKNYSHSSSILSSKTDMRYSKKCAKNKCVCFYETMWLIIMKMRVKMKNRSHRNNIHKTRLTHGFEYTKYKISQYDDGYVQ